VLLLAGVKVSFAGTPAAWEIERVALALIRPAELAVMVAVPAVEAAKIELAIPAVAATELGLNEPLTPLTEKVTTSVEELTVLPLASSTVAV
jgi:hypothetical protein